VPESIRPGSLLAIGLSLLTEVEEARNKARANRTGQGDEAIPQIPRLRLGASYQTPLCPEALHSKLSPIV
jgi:hypothetical protein